MTDDQGYTTLLADDAFWRPSNQMRIDNTDIAGQLGATTLGMRLWRLAPGQASTRHRHAHTHEIYVVLEGSGRIRIGDDVLTLPPLSSVHVEPDVTRQVFNDTQSDVLWLMAGAPTEPANTLEMTAEMLAHIYPDGPRALPPEIDVNGPAASER